MQLYRENQFIYTPSNRENNRLVKPNLVGAQSTFVFYSRSDYSQTSPSERPLATNYQPNDHWSIPSTNNQIITNAIRNLWCRKISNLYLPQNLILKRKTWSIIIIFCITSVGEFLREFLRVDNYMLIGVLLSFSFLFLWKF